MTMDESMIHIKGAPQQQAQRRPAGDAQFVIGIWSCETETVRFDIFCGATYSNSSGGAGQEPHQHHSRIDYRRLLLLKMPKALVHKGVFNDGTNVGCPLW